MQGFNMGRYVPPEHEGVTSANKLAGKHALGARARKLPQGILTVRFEMPFAVWCTTCPKPTIIGQGVRFNAEKKKVGNYFSTPIYSFRMKHVVCGGIIEIRTDPKNTAYVVTEGGKKRDTGEDKELEGEISIKTEEERERLRNDAFAALEGKVADKRQAEQDSSRIRELAALRERDWADPYEGSQKLRKTFRVKRKEWERNEQRNEALKDKLSLGIDLLEETEEDRQRAGLVDFGPPDVEAAIDRVKARSLFAAVEDPLRKSKDEGKSRRKKRLKKGQVDSAALKKNLQKELQQNTALKIDPFLLDEPQRRPTSSNGHLLTGIKRKKLQLDRDLDEDITANSMASNSEDPANADDSTAPISGSVPLVDYDSD
ncbi:MAG: hypothetical protein M1823_002613 [Watsoniomyces obsoletus]|nr:MAG: hypothetical protein M1823_002613 [Watsoniomyces obsoletus]